MKSERESNIELARIVAMSMIVIGHFVMHGCWSTVIPGPYSSYGKLDADDYTLIIISILCNAGTNLFILISGYFGIRLRWKSLISFYLLCLFYNVFNLCVTAASQPVGILDVVHVFFISRTGNWFFRAYFWLMLTSPIINAALNHYSVRQLRILTGFALLLTCISGWIFSNGNANGMTVLQMMAVYFIGGYIRRETVFKESCRANGFALYVGSSVMNLVAAMIVYYLLKKEFGILLQHNNILEIFSAVGLLLLFKSYNFYSKTVNSVASTVVAALFIQDVIFKRQIYGFLNDLYVSDQISLRLTVSSVILFLAIFAAAFIVEYLRKLLATPIAESCSKKMDSWFPLYFKEA